MKHVLNMLLIEVSALCGAAFFVGAAAGVAGLLFGNGLAGVADVVARVYWALLVALPVALWLPHYAMEPLENATVYTRLVNTLVTVLLGGLIGGALGAGPLFLLTGVNIPIVLGGLEATAFSDAVRAPIFWGNFGLVVGVTVLAGALISLWAYAAHSRDVLSDSSVHSS